MSEAMAKQLVIKPLGLVDYRPTWQAMQDFTAARTSQTLDELWVLQHPPTYTQGRNGDPSHLLNTHPIPVIPIDRGGQVTYHGPGQLVIYPLLNIQRRQWDVRQLVSWLEDSVVQCLAANHIAAAADPKAPGVYIQGAKIASVGLRVSRNCSYHGLSVNVDMDLTPFSGINPCGFQGLNVTQWREHIAKTSVETVSQQIVTQLCKNLPPITESA